MSKLVLNKFTSVSYKATVTTAMTLGALLLVTGLLLALVYNQLIDVEISAHLIMLVFAIADILMTLTVTMALITVGFSNKEGTNGNES